MVQILKYMVIKVFNLAFSPFRSTVLLKQEAVMVSLYHNINHNYVIITPDVNKLDANPYMLETASGDFLGHQYEVDVDFREEGASEELVTLVMTCYLADFLW